MQKKYSGLIDQICLVASHKLEKSGLVRKKMPQINPAKLHCRLPLEFVSL